MRNWNKPEIEEINVTLTMQGKEPSNTEANQGELTDYIYVSAS